MSGDIKSLRALLPEGRGSCPCCGKSPERSRLLPCLHSICGPCLSKVEMFLRKIEKRKGGSIQLCGTPLGWFMCPVCHSCHLVSRLGAGDFPLSCPPPLHCPTHLIPPTQYCHNCRSMICPSCEDFYHENHYTQDLATITSHLTLALREALKEITQRMKSIDGSIEKIKTARKLEIGEKKSLRKEVVSFYEGYMNSVRQHKKRLEGQIDSHLQERENLLIKEELELEQYKKDLELLCSQIKSILEEKDGAEVMRLMVPLAKRLESISEKILATGESISNRLEFVPNSFSEKTHVPGSLSTWTVSTTKSHADISSTFYEKVQCFVPLVLVDDSGRRMVVYRDIDIKATMRLYPKESITRNIEVTIAHEAGSDWRLTFVAPEAGIAHLAIRIGDQPLKNSPYVLNIRELALKPENLDNECEQVQYAL